MYLAGNTRHPDGRECRPSGVNCLGPLDRPTVASWLGRAWVYALPARYEPFGLSILEAASAGCALVLGRLDSLREIWGDSALYVEPDDAVELASAIDCLMRDDPLRRRLAGAARARASAFTAGRMAGEYLDLYRALSSGGRAATAARQAAAG